MGTDMIMVGAVATAVLWSAVEAARFFIWRIPVYWFGEMEGPGQIIVLLINRVIICMGVALAAVLAIVFFQTIGAITWPVVAPVVLFLQD